MGFFRRIWKAAKIAVNTVVYDNDDIIYEEPSMAIKVILDKIVEQSDGTFMAYVYALNDQTQEILESTSLIYTGQPTAFRTAVIDKMSTLVQKAQRAKTAREQINAVIADIEL